MLCLIRYGRTRQASFRPWRIPRALPSWRFSATESFPPAPCRPSSGLSRPTSPDPLRAYKASVFSALAHPTRIAIVEILRDGELSAGAMQAKLGIEQANLSQHLTILRSRQIVVNRKGGNQVFYSLSNPVLCEVLDIMRHYCQTNLHQAIQMMGEMNREAQD